jgi:hypothetical protein
MYCQSNFELQWLMNDQEGHYDQVEVYTSIASRSNRMRKRWWIPQEAWPMSELPFELDDGIFCGHPLGKFSSKFEYVGLSDIAPNTDSWLDSDSQI